MKDRRKALMHLTSGILRYTADFFHREGFVQMMPVMLSPVTDPLGPDPGSSVIKTGEIEYLGQRLVLTQSMILHKQLAIRSGLDRIFIISPNVRLEHPARRETGRHLFEFSQADFEISRGGREDVFALMERFLAGLPSFMRLEYEDELALLGRKLPDFEAPFPRHTTHELKERHGADWEHVASRGATQPFWALDHKREFYDKEDPERPGHYLNYDLIYPEGFGEALSGGEREHEYGRIVSRIGGDRLSKPSYAPYLELAKGGMVPSAGGGFGVERLVRFVAGAPHVGDVQLFRRVPGEPVLV